MTLEADGEGVHRAARVSLERPEVGTTYAVGKLQGLPSFSGQGVACGNPPCLAGLVSYGIERWYGPQGKPAELDRIPSGEVRVEARLGADGTLRLDGIRVRGETFAKTARLW